MTWSETFLDVFKKNDVRFISYVPDNVLTPLIKSVTSDNYFISVNATREDEAMGMVAGAWMGGMKGVVLMQTSGFAVAPNALASLLVPFQIPAILVISERGTLGEFNLVQVGVAKIMRPILNTLAVEHHTLTDENKLGFVLDASIKQAVATQSPVAFILSPLLTGGNPVSHARLSN
jgi:sulfopyruvate decarboxylase alpha subunit